MFDPYRKWLGIPADSRPPTHYQLLGISPDEQDQEVIDAAVIRQSAYVRNFQGGKYAQDATRVLNEIAAARLCLLNPARRKQYDQALAGQAAQTPAPKTKLPSLTEPYRPSMARPGSPTGPVLPAARPAAPLAPLAQRSADPLNALPVRVTRGSGSMPRRRLPSMPRRKKSAIYWEAPLIIALLLVLIIVAAIIASSRRGATRNSNPSRQSMQVTASPALIARRRAGPAHRCPDSRLIAAAGSRPGWGPVARQTCARVTHPAAFHAAPDFLSADNCSAPVDVLRREG